MTGPAAACPLCRSDGVNPFANERGRRFYDCPFCRLIFLAPEQRVDRETERAHYATHQNDPADPRYRSFLSRLTTPLVERLPAGAEGLDYGSGPGPTLSVMLREQGFRLEIYDPLFAPDDRVLERSYAFVTCSETIEHFFDPAAEFARLDELLHPGGWLAVMTEMFRDERTFTGWWYARDPTHVCFYRPATMEWIAERFGWSPVFPHRNVVLFRKPSSAGG